MNRDAWGWAEIEEHYKLAHMTCSPAAKTQGSLRDT